MKHTQSETLQKIREIVLEASGKESLNQANFSAMIDLFTMVLAKLDKIEDDIAYITAKLDNETTNDPEWPYK